MKFYAEAYSSVFSYKITLRTHAVFFNCWTCTSRCIPSNMMVQPYATGLPMVLWRLASGGSWRTAMRWKFRMYSVNVRCGKFSERPPECFSVAVYWVTFIIRSCTFLQQIETHSQENWGGGVGGVKLRLHPSVSMIHEIAPFPAGASCDASHAAGFQSSRLSSTESAIWAKKNSILLWWNANYYLNSSWSEARGWLKVWIRQPSFHWQEFLPSCVVPLYTFLSPPASSLSGTWKEWAEIQANVMYSTQGENGIPVLSKRENSLYLSILLCSAEHEMVALWERNFPLFNCIFFFFNKSAATG